MDSDVSQKLENFFKKYRHQKYQNGEILIRADDEPSGIYYLTKGAIKEYAISKKGEELVVNMFKPVSFFPMSWAINQTPNIFYFEAISETEIYLAPRSDVVFFIKENPDVLFNLMSRVYKGTDGILMRMVYLMSGEAYARVITELLIAAKRFGTASKGEVRLPFSEKDLANQSGMARETVSREIKKLKDKDIVSVEKNVLIVNSITELEDELIAQS